MKSLHLLRGALLGATLSVSVGAQTLTHQWRFGEDDTGATLGGTIAQARDSIGSTHLTPSDVATYSSATPGAGSSLAASFPTSGVYFTGAVDTSLTATSSFFLEAWFYLGAPTSSTSYVFFNGSASSGFGFYIDHTTLYYQTPGGAPSSLLGNANVGAWNYLAFVYSNGAVHSYLNNDDSPSYWAHDFVTPAGDGGLQIGGTMVGRLDEVRVGTFTGPLANFNSAWLSHDAVSAIPEPSTYAAIAGALGLGLVVWRRRVAARR